MVLGVIPSPSLRLNTTGLSDESFSQGETYITVDARANGFAPLESDPSMSDVEINTILTLPIDSIEVDPAAKNELRIDINARLLDADGSETQTLTLIHFSRIGPLQ